MKLITKAMGLRAAKPDLNIPIILLKIFGIEKINGMKRAMGKNLGLIEGKDWGSKGKDGIKNFGNSKPIVDLTIFDTIIGIKSQGLRKSLMKGENDFTRGKIGRIAKLGALLNMKTNNIFAKIISLNTTLVEEAKIPFRDALK